MRMIHRALLPAALLTTFALSCAWLTAVAAEGPSAGLGSDASKDPAAPAPAPAAQPPAAEAKAPPAKGDDKEGAAARSEAVIDMLHKGEYAKIHAQFTSKLGSLLPADQLKTIWEEQLTEQVGEYKSHGKAELSTEEGYTVGTVPVSFARAELIAQISWTDKGQIGGIYFKPTPQK
jgi:hypothetical protein